MDDWRHDVGTVSSEETKRNKRGMKRLVGQDEQKIKIKTFFTFKVRFRFKISLKMLTP